MFKNLILVLAIAMSGMAHADFQTVQSSEVKKADAGEVFGGLLAALILGKIIKEATDDDDDHQEPVDEQTERVRIPMGGELAKGFNTIHLKQELQAMGYVPRHRTLKKVILVAKSKKGQGEAYLQLGDHDKPTKILGQSKMGHPFNSNARESYHRVQWNANRSGKDGVWQIHMQGRIKVRAVIVELL